MMSKNDFFYLSVFCTFACFSRSLSEPLMTYSLHGELILAASMTANTHRQTLLCACVYFPSLMWVSLVQLKRSYKRGKKTSPSALFALSVLHNTISHISDPQPRIYVPQWVTKQVPGGHLNYALLTLHNKSLQVLYI